MAKKEREGTEWGMIASGEGANKIAIQYLSEFKSKYMSDRILLLNTTASDIRPEKAFGSRINPEFQSILQKIKKEKTCIFGGAPSGAGNVWKIGEDEATKDFETIRRYFANSQLAQADVVLGLATLGGGTGNGSLPYVISQLKSKTTTGAQGNYISLGIWPLDSEASQRHFNAICGFTRLLRYGPNGKRNSDLVIIVHNSKVAELIGDASANPPDKYYLINLEIIKAMDMMVAPSGKASEATIDVADYYQLPTSFGVYHFTPCISWDNDPKVIGLEAGLELALRSPMCPMEEKTATMAYFIVRAPEKHIKNGTFTQERLEEVARKLSLKFMAGSHGGLVRYCSLNSKEGEGFDAMVLLGGFSLKKLLSGSIGKFKAFSENLRRGPGDTLELTDDEHPNIRAAIKPGELETIERWLREYSKKTEDLIEKAKKGGPAEEEMLEGWMEEGKALKETPAAPIEKKPTQSAKQAKSIKPAKPAKQALKKG
ncbi:MAG: hypothetical protein V1909_00930 [Candidatus Micrarchaeota archaeon]